MEHGSVSPERTRIDELTLAIDDVYRRLVHLPKNDRQKDAFRVPREEHFANELRGLARDFPPEERTISHLALSLEKTGRIWRWDSYLARFQQAHFDDVTDDVARILLADLAMANVPLPHGIEEARVTLEDSLRWQGEVKAEAVHLSGALGSPTPRESSPRELSDTPLTSREIWRKLLEHDGALMKGRAV